MRLDHLFVFTAAGLLFTFAHPAHAQLEWQVSVKVFLDENDNRAASGSLVTDQDIMGVYDVANGLLDGFGRGYRFNVIEIVELSGFSTWFYESVGSTERADLQAAAEADPAAYAYRSDAMNVYVFGTSLGANGWCSRPSGNTNQVTILSQSVNDLTPFHEAGHVLGLCHTHGCSASSSNCDGSVPIDDSVADTIPDKACWTQDEIANAEFGDDYANLSAAEQGQVDDVWQNVMSYHDFPNRTTLTSDQLDIVTDISNTTYFPITTGTTRFVDVNYTGEQNGSSTAPYITVQNGVNAATPEDIILIRTGIYDESTTISKAVTLRASRGNAIIGI